MQNRNDESRTQKHVYPGTKTTILRVLKFFKTPLPDGCCEVCATGTNLRSICSTERFKRPTAVVDTSAITTIHCCLGSVKNLWFHSVMMYLKRLKLGVTNQDDSLRKAL